MTSALVASTPAPGVPSLLSDLESVGIHVLGEVGSGSLVRDVIRSAPDLVVCYESHPDDALFASTAALYESAPRPMVVFTSDPDADKIERATRSGIHAYVINGYGLHRLRSVIHVAQARFRHDQLLREELSDVNHRFGERKLVDRAKGILMRARQISEDEAFRILRTAAMHGKQRVGQVSQQVIDSARYAESVNRAGQLRMLSQRLVKLYALLCGDVNTEESRGLFNDSFDRIDNNLSILGKSLSKATFGDLLDATLAPWTALKTALALPAKIEKLQEIDTLAERFLTQAEQLTTNLETAGFATTLHVINVSGRQRMLSQRVAKLALLTVMLPHEAAQKAATEAEVATTAFIEAMAYLNAIPLSTLQIRQDLEGAATSWQTLQHALPRCATSAGQRQVADSSEALLGLFDRLTDSYERSMQMLMG